MKKCTNLLKSSNVRYNLRSLLKETFGDEVDMDELRIKPISPLGKPSRAGNKAHNEEMKFLSDLFDTYASHGSDILEQLGINRPVAEIVPEMFPGDKDFRGPKRIQSFKVKFNEDVIDKIEQARKDFGIAGTNIPLGEGIRTYLKNGNEKGIVGEVGYKYFRGKLINKEEVKRNLSKAKTKDTKILVDNYISTVKNSPYQKVKKEETKTEQIKKLEKETFTQLKFQFKELENLDEGDTKNFKLCQ